MKTKIQLIPSISIVTFAVALTITTKLKGGEVRPASQPAVNRAVLASPRTFEEFPELARTGASSNTSNAKAWRAGAVLAKLAQNRPLAASPRFIEEYPQVARATREADAVGLRTGRAKRASALRGLNSALASSPRALEEFPWLARGGKILQSSNEKFRIAPLK